MVPKLHAKGRSFRGAAAYLLHDKGRARTADRVAWTQTRNLATDDPQVAWRIMAATALDQARLKERAGVKNSGRRSADSVLHLTLSWHPDEKEALTREEMLRAAYGAIRALKAEDRQTLVVCHSDEPQPHLHVLLNRVSPEDGRILPSSKEKLELSRWAEGYERERGPVLCQERAINNAARKRGEFIRGELDTPRHIFELQAANAHKPGIGDVQEQQRANDRALAKDRRERANRRRRAWSEIQKCQRETLKDIRHRYRRDAKKARQEVRTGFKPRWSALLRTQDEQVRAFEANEGRFLGRMSNAFTAIELQKILGAGSRRRALGEAFDAIASKGARLEALRRVHEKARHTLLAQQRAEEFRAVKRLHTERDTQVAERRGAFAAERTSLILTHDLEDAAHRQEWRRRSEERRAAYERHRSEQEDPNRLEADDLLERLKRSREKRMGDGGNQDHRPRRGW